MKKTSIQFLVATIMIVASISCNKSGSSTMTTAALQALEAKSELASIAMFGNYDRNFNYSLSGPTDTPLFTDSTKRTLVILKNQFRDSSPIKAIKLFFYDSKVTPRVYLDSMIVNNPFAMGGENFASYPDIVAQHFYFNIPAPYYRSLFGTTSKTYGVFVQCVLANPDPNATVKPEASISPF